CTFALKHSALICSHLHSFPTRRSSDLAFLGLPVAFHQDARYAEGTPEVHGPFLGGEHQPGKQQEQHGHQPGQPMPSNGRSTLAQDRKSTRLNSSHVKISYAVFCLKKKN